MPTNLQAHPKNLGITRRLGVVSVCLITIICITTMVVFLAQVDGRFLQSTTVVPLIGVFGALVNSLIGALKATEVADTASKTNQIVAFTASQNATMQQLLASHCGDICPLDVCGLRKGTEANS